MGTILWLHSILNGRQIWVHSWMRPLVEWNRAISSPKAVSSNYNERLMQVYTRPYFFTTRLCKFRPDYANECPMKVSPVVG